MVATDRTADPFKDPAYLRRVLIHQFQRQATVFARPQPKRKKRRDETRDQWQPRLWQPKTYPHGIKASQQAVRDARSRGPVKRDVQIITVLSAVLDAAGAGAGSTKGWPESMTRELQACMTDADRNAWRSKWGAYLSGQVQAEAMRRWPQPNVPSLG